MKKSLIAALMFAALPRYMSEDAPAGTAATEVDAPNDAEVPPLTPVNTDVTMNLTLPAEHADLLERVASLLARGESWLKDNIEAGISHFEAMFKDSDNNVG